MTGAAAARQRTSVLVVEDDALNLMLMREYLEELDYRVIAAPSGTAAMARLTAEPRIAAMITDVHLGPGIDGVALARQARGLRPGLPVVYVTGTTLADDGWTDAQVLRKPVRITQIADALAAVAVAPMP